MKRRKFVLLAGLAIPAVAVPSLYYNYGDLEYDLLVTEPEMLSHIWDGEMINKVGEIYREQFREENSERKLVRLLMKDISSEHADLTKALRTKITNDFKSGDTVMIDGWILSRTEARQCALFSLTQNI